MAVSLTYFDGRGLGELPRLLLHEAGVKFEDRRVKDIADLKPSLPFGQVPLYQEGDFRLVQSQAIARYIARTHNLYGKDAKEAAQIDLVVDGINDLRTHFRNANDDAAKAKFASEVLPKWLGHFENILKSNHGGQGFIVGDQISWADVALYYFIDVIAQAHQGALTNFPLLAAHGQRIAARPNIAAWLKVRPATPW